MRSEKKEILLDFQTNALKAKQEAEELKKTLSDTSKEYKDLTDKTDELDKTILELEEGIKDLSKATEEGAESTEALSDSYDSLTDRAKATISSTQKLNKELSNQKKTTTEVTKVLKDNTLVTSILDKATGGYYSTIKDTVTQVFELAKSLKVATAGQGALTVGTNTTSVAMRVLRTAIISTGIGALIVAVGYLAGKMMELADATNVSTESLDKNKRALEGLKNAHEEINDFLDFSYQIDIERAKRAGASEERLSNMRSKFSQERIANIDKEMINIERLKKQENLSVEANQELNNRLNSLSKERSKIFTEELLNEERDKTALFMANKDRQEKEREEALKRSEDRKREREEVKKNLEGQFKDIQTITDKYRATNASEDGYSSSQASALYSLKKEREDIVNEIESIKSEFNSLSKAEQEEMRASYDRFLSNSEEVAKEIEDTLNSLYDTFDKENSDALMSAFNGYVEKQPLQYIISDLRSFEDEFLTVSERIGLKSPAKLLTEDDINKVRDYNLKLLEEQKTKAQADLEEKGATNEMLLELDKQYNEAVIQENKNSADAIMQINSIKAESYLATAGEISNTLGTLSEVSKEGSGVQKGLAIASVLVETGRSAISSFRSFVEAYPAPYGQIAGALASTSAIAMGMKQVANLKKVKTDGTETGGGQSASGTITAQSQPNVSFVSSSDNQIKSAIADSADAQNDKPIKTYVVSSDVTSAQELDRKRIEETSI